MWKWFYLSIFFQLATPSLFSKDWSDRVEYFRKQVEKEHLESFLKKELSPFYILMRPGILDGLHKKLHSGYFQNFTHCLKELDLKKNEDFDITFIKGPSTVNRITDKLYQHIELILQNERHKKLILIGHSKGGFDLYSTLKKYPKLIDSTEGLFLIQSPLKGSPFAQMAEEKWYLHPAFSLAIRLSDDVWDTFRELRPIKGKTLYDKYRDELDLKIPTLTISAKVPASKTPNFWPLTLSHRLLLKQGTPENLRENDGLVPYNSSTIPEIFDHVELKNTDHGDIVMRPPFYYRWTFLRNYNKTCFHYVYPLLAVMLEKSGHPFNP